MRGIKWLILVASLLLIFSASSIGVTSGSFVELEDSTGNVCQAWTVGVWTQTTQADFEAGVGNNVDSSSSAGDVMLAGQGGQSIIAADGFEEGWSGGSGWLWGWWHEGSSSLTTSGNPHGGNCHLLMTSSNAYVDRALDLSGQSNVHLQFWAKADSFESGDFAECYIYDGVDWNVVETWVDGEDDSIYHFYDIDLSSFNMSNQFYVCFDTEMSDTDDYLYIDDLELVTTSGWYNSSWGCRAPVTINNSGSSLTNYQVRVAVNYDADMRPDFDDIRFTDSDGSTELAYWRESYITATSATFWVKVSSVPSGAQIIYMYYGNAGAGTASNGDATFEFFDDFEDGSISDWSQYGSGTVQIANDSGNYVLLKTAYNDSHGGYSLFNNGALSNFEAVFKTKRINENGGAQNRYGIENGSFNGYGPRMADFNSLPAAFAIERRSGGGGSNLTSENTSAYQWNSWMTVKFRKYGTNLEFELYNSSGSLVESISTSNSSYNSFDRFVVHGGYEFYTDDIRVRQYVSSEPVANVGVEEGSYISPGTLASQVLDTGVSGTSWNALFWDEILESGTDITFEVRASDSLNGGFPDAAWIPVGGTSPVSSGLPSGRYMQWRATLTTSNSANTPTLREVRLYHY
jgi:hypothetical protein